MMKYKIIEIAKFEKKIINGEKVYFISINFRKEKKYKINKSIYDFAILFIKPNSLEDVKKFYKNKDNYNQKEINKLDELLNIFFNQLIKNKILVDEHFVLPKFDFKPQFNNNEIINNNFLVLDCISDNKVTDIYLVTDKNNKKLILKYLNKKKLSIYNKNRNKQIDYYKNSLLDECSYLKKFKSNSINKCIKFVSNDDDTFLVLEYIEGVNLFKHIISNKMNENEKKQLIVSLIKAFNIIHEHNIFHGDIHNGNVLIDVNNSIKIIDFGLSRDNDNQKIGKNGGVHFFISPERLFTNNNLKKFKGIECFQSEVYQIGLLCYFIMFERLPFNSYTWKELVDEKIYFDSSKIKTKNNRINDLLIKSLDRIPENRFKSAVEMYNFISK